jgi:hypothetical protein
MSLRPHFIKISDVLVRGIARSTVKREMLRSLRHIAETIDAVMIAEGIEHVEDVVALRDLGLRYGQGYYMARPAPPFVGLSDGVRAELRSVAPHAPTVTLVAQDDEDDDDDEASLAIPLAAGSVSTLSMRGASQGIPRGAFGRPEDEITSDFQLPEDPPTERPRPRASIPPAASAVGSEVGQPLPWRPLIDEDTASAEAEPLLESLRRDEGTENGPDGEHGGGRPGLN